MNHEDVMIFVSLSKFKQKPTKEGIARGNKIIEQMKKEGIKILGWYWTLGRYDAVLITEGPDEAAVSRAIKYALMASEVVSTETMVALRREDAIKLVQ